MANRKPFPAWRTRTDGVYDGRPIRAMGAKPADKRLKRALFDSIDEFFIPLPQSAQSQSQTYTEFAQQRTFEVNRGQSVVYIVPMLDESRVSTPLIDALSSYMNAFLASAVRVQVHDAVRPLDTRFYRRPNGTMDTRVVCGKIMDMMKRSLPHAMLQVVVTDIFWDSQAANQVEPILYAGDGMIILDIQAFMTISAPAPVVVHNQRRNSSSSFAPGTPNIFSSAAAQPAVSAYNPFASPPAAPAQQQQQQQQYSVDIMYAGKLLGREICRMFGIHIPCGHFKCLLNAYKSDQMATTGVPGILCPVDLRKLILVCGLQTNPLQRYRELAQWYQQHRGGADEHEWLMERIHVLSA